MANIEIKVKPQDEIEDKEEELDSSVKVELQVRKTIDGKIMILDHAEMDIVIDPETKNIITFPKEEMSDEVYQTQNNYFKFLSDKGVVDRSTVHAGNVFASIQGGYPDAVDEGIDATQLVLLSTHKFIEKDRPRYETEQYINDEIDDHYVHPTEEDSTALGEVPEEPQKGTINPNNPWALYTRYPSYEWA